VAGVSASTPERARAAARQLDTVAFDSAEELAASPEVDVVHICTPNHLHVPVARIALEAGKHVICEKPLAIDSAGGDELAALAQDAGLLGAVPFVYRFYPMVREAKARVAAGEIGRVHLIHGGYLQDWLLSPQDTNWRVDAAIGGASRAFADIGCHWCDLIEFVSGERITAVSAHLQIAVAGRETEDAALVVLRTESGVLGSAVISQVSAGHKNQLHFELSGSVGAIGFAQETPESLRVATPDAIRTLVRDPGRLSPGAGRYARVPAGHPQGYDDCLDAFVADAYAAIGAEPVAGLPDFEAAARAVRITEAVIASSAADGDWVSVQAPATPSV
jgi:predicted dehydrogenase